MKKILMFVFLLMSAAQAAPLTTKTTLSCQLGEDNYNSIVLTPSDKTWLPINDPTQGIISIVFAGRIFSGMMLGSYRFGLEEPRFAVTSYGDPDTLVTGTISGLTTANPVLRVTNGAYFISKKNIDVPCVLR